MAQAPAYEEPRRVSGTLQIKSGVRATRKSFAQRACQHVKLKPQRAGGLYATSLPNSQRPSARRAVIIEAWCQRRRHRHGRRPLAVRPAESRSPAATSLARDAKHEDGVAVWEANGFVTDGG